MAGQRDRRHALGGVLSDVEKRPIPAASRFVWHP